MPLERVSSKYCPNGFMGFVADEEDAQEAMRRFGVRRGEVWIPGEIELVARFRHQDIRDEAANFKRGIDDSLSRD